MFIESRLTCIPVDVILRFMTHILLESELSNSNNVNHLRKLGIFSCHAFNLKTELI